MPIYCFNCKDCGREFEEMRLMKNSSDPATCECGGIGTMSFNIPNLIFANPKDTSKWDNFSYRAGFNMEKAKGERRDAEAAANCQSPYESIEDCDMRGVFDKGGADNNDTPGLVIPS